jgi:hypothetical protein
MAHVASRDQLRLADAKIKNVYGIASLFLVPGSREDMKAEYRRLDTFKNASLTVGTGKTYATITAAITAASSGDAILCYATGSNTYSENVDTVDKALQIVGIVADQGLKITASSGIVVLVQDNKSGGLLDNFEVEGTGTVTQIVYMDGDYGVVRRIKAHGVGNNGILVAAATSLAENSIVYDTTYYGVQLSGATCLIAHCTTVDCGHTGVYRSAANTLRSVACLSSDNATADFSTMNANESKWNVSKDGSAGGIAPVTGFDNADFVDYAGNDFHLKTSVAATTKARFAGAPLVTKDIADQGRKLDSGIFFAGASDADPVTVAVPTTPTFSVVDDGDGTNFTATIDGDAGVTNYVKYRAPDGTTWTAGGNRAGDGDVKVAAGQGHYDVSVYSVSAAGVASAWADIKDVFVLPSKSWNDESAAGGGGSWTHET